MQKKLTPAELDLYIIRRDIFKWCEEHETMINNQYLVKGCRVSKREDDYVVVDATGELTGNKYVVVEDIGLLNKFYNNLR